MIQKLINFYLYPLKKKGKLKILFLFYRNFIIFSYEFKFNLALFFDKIYLSNLISYKTMISIYLEVINKIIENEITFDYSKLDYYSKKADDLYLKNKKKIKLYPYSFYREYAQIKLNTLNFKSYFAIKKEHNENLLKLQINDDFFKKNIRFIKAKDIYNTIGLSYITDVTLKSSKLGLISKFKFICLVHDDFKNKSINDFYIKKLKDYVEFIYDNSLINKYKKYEDLFDIRQNDFYNFNDKLYLYTQSAGLIVNKLWENKNNKPIFLLNDEEIKTGWRILNKVGVKKGDWFVTAHIRDPGFKGFEKHRDADIENYFPAFTKVTEVGGWIFRIGDSNSKKIPKMNKVIDYPYSNIKSDFMDIFLSTQCRFMIGTSSGMSAISYIAKVPIAMTNYRPLSTLYLSSRDLYLPGLLTNKDGKFLTFKELYKTTNSIGALDGVYTNLLNLSFYPNTPEEIKKLVECMLVKLKGNDIDYKSSIYQNTIKKIIKNNNTLLCDNIGIETDIPEFFLEKYKELL